ncbi:MAG: glycosyltransferase family 39 protein [Thermoanaerobaculia bacterium]
MGKAGSRGSGSAPPQGPPRLAARRARIAGAAIFAASFAVRLLFWQATPDRGWAGSAWYQGDAAVWVEYATALERGEPFELGLPLRPPATAYLIAAASHRPGEPGELRFLWCLLGALTVLALYRAALRSFGLGVAVGVGLLTAASSGLLMLSSSLNNETPYLMLFALLLWLAPTVATRPRPAALAAWGGLHGLACLFRVEHAVFFGLTSIWLGARWWRSSGGRRAAVQGVQVGVSLGLALLPWHLAAWPAVARFNREPGQVAPGVERAQRALEDSLARIAWSEAARAEAARLPAFARRTAVDFVAATVAHRGRSRVEADDLGILEDAFGYRPRALAAYPFIASSGGLNFALANRPGADGGFSRAALEAPPPLAGGRDRYPSFLVAGLPPPDLSLTYPPHLRLVNEGYAVGWHWLAQRPARTWALLAAKLERFWRGAALGWTGYDLPLGASGRREPVDLVVPQGPAATIWQIGLLLGVVAGLAAARGRSGMAPWLLFLGSKLFVTLAFYGYARQGASTIPVVALLLVLAAERWLPAAADSRKWLRIALAGSLAVVGVEALRWLRPPELFVDGQPIVAGARPPAEDHRAHQVRAR